MKAVLLFAHGARDPRWAEPFQAVLAQVQASRPQDAVRLCFLELMQPSLPDAVADVLALGVRDIAIVPLFLGAGGHIRRDLPQIVADLLGQHPGVRIRLEPILGERPEVLQSIARSAGTIDWESGDSP